MADNLASQYDDILGAAPASVAPPMPSAPAESSLGSAYDQILGPSPAVIAGAKARTAPANPQTYGEAVSLERSTGIPAAVAARNMDQARKIKQGQDMRQFAEAHAAGALWLAQGDNAALSHDDLDAMSRISVAGKAINVPFVPGTGPIAAFGQNIVAHVPAFLSDATKIIGGLLGALDPGIKDPMMGGGSLTDLQDAIFRNFTDPLHAAAENLRTGEASRAHPLAARTGDVAGTLAEFAVGPRAETKAGELVAPWIEKFVADPRVQRFLTRAAQHGAENLPTASRISVEQATEASTAQAQAGVPLSQQQAAYAVSVPIGAIANAAPIALPGRVAVRALTGEGIGLALSYAQQAAEHAVAPDAVAAPGAPDFTDPATYLPALLAVLFGERGGRLPQKAPTPEQVDAAANVLHSTVVTSERVQAAQHNAEQLNYVMEAAKDSKLATRSPETLQDFVATVADHTVYLPVDVVDQHFAGKGLDPAMEVSKITGSFDAHDEAELTGYLEIPLSDYAVRGQELHTALGDHAKLDEDGIAPAQIVDTVEAHQRAVEGLAILSEAPPSVSDFLTSLRQEIGWDQIGGRIIRSGELEESPTGMRTAGDVVGRTKWIGKTGPDGAESNFWRLRPDPINEAQAHAALDKQAAGEKLTTREQRFIDYASKYAENQLADYQEQAQANPEHQALAEQAAQAEAAQKAREQAQTGLDAAIANSGITTSIRNAVTEAEAVRDNVERIYSEAGPSDKQLFEAGMQHAQAHPDAGRRLTDALLANPRPITAAEDVALLVDRIRIHNEAADARGEVANKRGKSDAEQAADLANLEAVEQQRRNNDLALRQSGTANAQGLRARQLFATLDYQLETLLQKAETANGKPLPAHITTRLEEMAKTIADLNARIAEGRKAKAERAAPKGPQKTVEQKVQDRVRSDIAKLEATIKERLKACPV